MYESPSLARRRKTSLLLGGCGVVLTLGWAIGQVVSGWPGLWVNVAGMTVFGAGTLLGFAGHHRLGGHLGIVWAGVHLWLLGLVGHAVASGAFRWFYVVALVPFYMLDERDRVLRYVYGAMAGVSVVIFELGGVRSEAPPVNDNVLLALNPAINSGLVVLLLVAIIGAVAREQTAAELQAEGLLLRILPAPVVARLRSGEARIAESIDDATVLFADLVGFTGLAASRTPAELVDVLEQMFLRFDAIAERHGLEKIKTIGDAYMAVAGVLDRRGGHASRAAAAALDMREAVKELAEELGAPLQIRVGLHRGPLVAGVLGEARLAFDVWGDTVNVASRMESHGVPGEIHLTRAIKDAIHGELDVRPRGTIEVKGLGTMETYFLVAPRGEPHGA